MPMTDQLRA